ncbi:serine/threonine-protein kinase [Peribacillus asahii]|uniref:serine/threonine-protein kinase n=1 Tax=Peribacillus asahii TaxID=228899 RepID=UPI0037F9DA3C
MMFQHLYEIKYNRLFIDHINQNDKYEFSDTLGMGSFGVAYLLQHKLTNEKYVLKRLRAKHKNKASTKNNFQQEIAFLQKEMHPNLPTIKEEGFVKGLPFYMMDFIEGHTFEHLIFNKGQTFSVHESLTLVKQLLEIVLTIHDHGIVHRDLRIPNILLHHNKLYVIDFGLACYMKESINIDTIKNPKKVENYISDLYYIGHFLLYLLYSNYTPHDKKERCWQEELQLPLYVQHYIERLLLIEQAFPDTRTAYEALPL